jgi:hypothetical protein
LGENTKQYGYFVKKTKKMRTPKDIANFKFGRLTALKSIGKRGPYYIWECACECGKTANVVISKLINGHTQSCGCLNKERVIQTRTIHGGTKTPEYRALKTAIQRCCNKNIKAYPNYGGRGIRVCDKWVNNFQDFLNDVGPRPSSKHSLDRYPDNDGHYEPGNVRWATKAEQNENRRSTVWIECNGIRLNITKWAELLGINRRKVSFYHKTGRFEMMFDKYFKPSFINHIFGYIL